jgi:putative membrane protein
MGIRKRMPFFVAVLSGLLRARKDIHIAGANRMRLRKHRGHGNHEVLKGLASGAIGGLVACWTMNQFQAELSKAAQALQAKRPRGQQRDDKSQSQGDGDDATMRTADWISKGLLHKALTKSQKKKLGPVVHYSFGTLTGALYGAVAEVLPQATVADGALFGTAVFAGADELSLWAVRLAGPPTQYPVSAHARALAAHCVYGMTAETVRRNLRRVW